jgi:hypothetical protein
MRDYTVVSNGRSNGRSSYQPIMQGRVTINGTDKEGKKFKRVVEIVDGEIMDNKYIEGGKLKHRVAYGRFETEMTPKGREITRFDKGKAKGKHGKSLHYGELFGYEGVCHTWYKHGRMIRQRFIYANGRVAYDYRSATKEFDVLMPNGEVMYQITGAINSNQNWTGVSILTNHMDWWFKHSHPFKVVKRGKLYHQGEYHNNQKVGKWYENGKVVFYEHGVAIPAKLFNTPASELNPAEILKIPNSQLRMAMMSKANFKAKALATLGTVIHKEGKMRLFDIPGLDTRILKVVCPSTSSLYYIHVPKDSVKCEEARQWTFHVGAGVRGVAGNEIKFTLET